MKNIMYMKRPYCCRFLARVLYLKLSVFDNEVWSKEEE